jgi:hypothetical protein
MRYLIVLAAAVPLLPSGLAAQNTQSGEAHRRTDCRYAEQVIVSGQPGHQLDWALEQLSSCPDNGPVVAGDLWRNAPSDTAGVARIRWVTHELRDQRLVDVLFEVARDAARARVIRKTAMLQLLTYAEPRDATFLSQLEPSDDYTWAAATLSHPVQHLDGAVPLRPTFRSDLLGFFRAVEQSDPDPSVRYAGRVLAEVLDRSDGG